MRGRNIRGTLLVGFGSLLFLLVATALTVIGQINSINSEMDAILHEHNLQISLMTTMRNAARERSLVLQNMLLTQDRFERDKLFLSLSDLSIQYAKARQELLSLRLYSEEKELLQQQHQTSIHTSELQNQFAQELISGNDHNAYEILSNDILPSQHQAMGLMDQFINMQQEHSETAYKDAEKRLKTITMTFLILLGCGIGIGSAIAIFVTRRIQSELDARRKSERELQKSEMRERIIRENIHDGIIITDEQGRIQSLNLAVSVIFGYETVELIGKNIEMLTGNSQEHELPLLESLLVDDDEPLYELTRELSGLNKDGDVLPLEVEVTQVRFDGQPHFIVVVRDISTRRAHEQLLLQHSEELERKVKARTLELTEEIDERRKAEEKLLYLASHDNLTGLPNRRLFMEQLELTLRRAYRQQNLVAIFFIDLDGFKAVNDTHGHDIGDKLLINVSQRIKKTIRDCDVASRLGGDEFTLIAAELAKGEDAQVIAEKLVTALSKPFTCENVICHVGASIGISIYPDHGSNAEQLLQLADDAMYRVKNNGKRGYVLHGSTEVCQPVQNSRKK